ncbi:MAG: gamma-butyrobetaine hydroxylase-like domain-containing protein, partial [Acidiferrobacterales bacterium]
MSKSEHETATKSHKPTDIKLHKKSRILEISFEDGSAFQLPCEYLRVHSPSAEVQGHGPGQEVLQLGKENVNIVNIEPVGHYAVVLEFDDEHNTGIYSWEKLYELGINQEKYWQS